jgi:hypothetical protein
MVTWIGRMSVAVLASAALAACTTDHTERPAGSIPWGTVTGTVRTATGHPAPGVLVVPTPADASTPPAPEKAVRTDDAGRYRWQLMPGRYVLVARHADQTSAGVPVTVTAGRPASADLVIG